MHIPLRSTGHPEEENVFEIEHLRELVKRLHAETGIPFSILPDCSADEQ